MPRHHRHNPALATLLMLLLAAASCAEPADREYFVKGPTGPYTFSLPLDDSLSAYDISFYTRISGRSSKLKAEPDFPIDVTWTSPSGSTAQEQVWFCIHGNEKAAATVQRTFFETRCTAPYMVGLVPSEAGEWQLTLTLPLQVEGILGMGVKVKRDGTR